MLKLVPLKVRRRCSKLFRYVTNRGNLPSEMGKPIDFCVRHSYASIGPPSLQEPELPRLAGLGRPLLVFSVTACVGDWGALLRKHKKRLVKSQTACQGILVGVYWSVTVWRLFISSYFRILTLKWNSFFPTWYFQAASLTALRQQQLSHKGAENMTLGSFDGWAWLSGPRPEPWR